MRGRASPIVPVCRKATGTTLSPPTGQMANRTTCTAEKRQAFLDALATGLSVSGSARRAGVPRRTLYERRDADEAFRLAWDAALADGTECLEDEARRRAYHGVVREHSHYSGGMRIGTDIETKYSDALLMFLLKARSPEKYRDNSRVELGGALGIKVFTDAIVNEI